jgi:hypothetical protein
MSPPPHHLLVQYSNEHTYKNVYTFYEEKYALKSADEWVLFVEKSNALCVTDAQIVSQLNISLVCALMDRLCLNRI